MKVQLLEPLSINAVPWWFKTMMVEWSRTSDKVSLFECSENKTKRERERERERYRERERENSDPPKPNFKVLILFYHPPTELNHTAHDWRYNLLLSLFLSLSPPHIWTHTHTHTHIHAHTPTRTHTCRLRPWCCWKFLNLQMYPLIRSCSWPDIKTTWAKFKFEEFRH